MDKNAAYYQVERNEMEAFLPEEYNKVLEIGCGEGNFTTQMKPVCEIWGIEPNNTAADIASKKMYRVLIGDYEQICDQLPDDYFELVVCNDVIEHMRDHDAFFESIRNKLKNNAYLVGSIPNVRFYFNLKDLLLKRDWLYADIGILDRTHLRFFTEVSLKRTLQQHAFAIDTFEGINKLQFDSFDLKSILHRLIIFCTTTVTFGSYNDIRYLQFAFRARKSIPSDQL